jgi:Na+/alanine symporter
MLSTVSCVGPAVSCGIVTVPKVAGLMVPSMVLTYVLTCMHARLSRFVTCLTGSFPLPTFPGPRAWC